MLSLSSLNNHPDLVNFNKTCFGHMHLLEQDIILESSFVSAFKTDKIASQRITKTKFELNVLRNKSPKSSSNILIIN